MKATIFSITGEKKSEIELPSFFQAEIRKDLIAKVSRAETLQERQAYGAAKLAGKRASAPGKIRHKRRAYKTAYGYGISRVPRKVMTKRGRRFFWQGAFAPGTVGGRRAHPPKPEKKWEIKVNKKEKDKALKSAIAATSLVELIKQNYKLNNFTLPLPLIVERKIEETNKVKELKKILLNLLKTDKFFPKRKIRAGKGKMRGRKHKKSAGLLLVVSKASKLKTKVFDIKEVKDLKVKDLAAGGKPGRLTIYSHNAILELQERFKGKRQEK
ncbi:50S ribosomal protein L4 [Candidatus Pacearchaeota archaeon ex4484_26]|nr:MAG: 50S ribosomal protein L4 [Candidatus Pacearchaeota archaeon ex4484_26]